ncbi:hypothetical protein DEO72_LG10g305 [Vigna unguiculata]|uniref:Uncharacterized protein n=1 Tax=Vigna unguiculata TaxID=3917 RepID=A0A4D6N5R5_VIGUN|nr:hypothetical protein DEO72_LG10g305 [Vigna unguiculata]
MAYQTPDRDSESDPQTPTRLYNPYKDLEGPIRNLYQLPTSPEYLFVEEARDVYKRQPREPFPHHTQSCSTTSNALPLHKSPPAPDPLPASLCSPQNPCVRETLPRETAAFFFVCQSPKPCPQSQIPNFIT